MRACAAGTRLQKRAHRSATVGAARPSSKSPTGSAPPSISRLSRLASSRAAACRPVGKRADGEAALEAVGLAPVVENEGAAAGSGDAAAEAFDVGVVSDLVAACWRWQLLNDLIGRRMAACPLCVRSQTWASRVTTWRPMSDGVNINITAVQRLLHQFNVNAVSAQRLRKRGGIRL